MSYTPVLGLPLIPQCRETVTPELRAWAQATEDGRNRFTPLAQRPAASATPKATLWGVDDCADDSCAADGGALHCLTIRSETATQWDVVGCFGQAGTGSYVTFSSCGPYDGTTPVFMTPNGCGDPAELNAQARVKGAASFGNVSCYFSGTTGAQSLLPVFRVGSCGGALTSTTVTCTVGPSGSPGGTCEGSSTASASAGQCMAMRLSGTGLVTAPGTLTCLVEQFG